MTTKCLYFVKQFVACKSTNLDFVYNFQIPNNKHKHHILNQITSINNKYHRILTNFNLILPDNLLLSGLDNLPIILSNRIK